MKIVSFVDDVGRNWSVEVAGTRLQRMRGLLGRRGSAEGSAMLFPNASAVHTIGMRFPISVVFLDEDMRVIRVDRAPPGRARIRCPGAGHVMEMDASARVEPGTSFSRSPSV